MGLILEYEGKDLFKKYKIPLLPSIAVKSEEEAKEASTKLSFPVAVKAQVLSGGRGKRGLIQLANSPDDVVTKAKDILGRLDEKSGKTVTHLLIEQGAEIEKELFISMLYDRATLERMILFSVEGGVDIETLAKERPEAIDKFFVPFGETAYPYYFMASLGKRGLTGKQKMTVANIITTLANMMITEDLTLAEINPLAITKKGEVIALDARIVTDDNASFRHPEREKYLSEQLRYTKEELDAKTNGLSYVDLGGEIAFSSVGAGMAMATADLIAEFGGTPKNFLDAGGGASADKIEQTLRIMIGTNPKAILVNAFGGITKTDDVARGIIAARKKFQTPIPMVFRLSGTNQDEALKLMKEANLIAYDSMEEAIQQAIKLSKGQ
jgi:succinyl-CoA synthetase beta subunit